MISSNDGSDVPVPISIPKLGLTMTEGTISGWVAVDGGSVDAGDVVLLLTTDKLETEVEAEAAGIVRHAVPTGTTLDCGAIAGWILAESEEPPPAGEPAAVAPSAASANGAAGGNTAAAALVPGNGARGGRRFVSPNARRLARERSLDLTAITGSGPDGRIVSEDLPVETPGLSLAPAEPQPDRSLRISPVARRFAEKCGVEPATVVPTGPGGRIMLDDVLAAVSASSTAPSPVPAPARPGAGDTIELRGMRGLIAERMHSSLQEMAQLTLGAEVTMDAAMALRAQLKEQWRSAGRTVPSVTDLVARSAALALVEHPILNATVADGRIHLLEDINLGIAVSVPHGLLVPVVRHVDLLPLDTLATETRRTAEAARSGALGPDELQGATFSITSLGTAGVDFFTPVVNPPNVAILGIGRARDGVAWAGDVPQRITTMTLSLTIDHRVVDGTPGAAFLMTVRDLLEAPLRLL